MTCDSCKHDHTGRAWHLVRGKTLCDQCYVNENPETLSTGASFEQKLVRSLPRGSVLGPKHKGTGMRGVYQRSRR